MEVTDLGHRHFWSPIDPVQVSILLAPSVSFFIIPSHPYSACSFPMWDFVPHQESKKAWHYFGSLWKEARLAHSLKLLNSTLPLRKKDDLTHQMNVLKVFNFFPSNLCLVAASPLLQKSLPLDGVWYLFFLEQQRRKNKKTNFFQIFTWHIPVVRYIMV